MSNIDHTTLASTPLDFPGTVFDSELLLEEVRKLFYSYKDALFQSPRLNVYVIPIFVPGGDWQETGNFKNESSEHWQEPAWTELANQCPYLKQMIEECFFPWNKLKSRIVIITPVNARGVVPHTDSNIPDFDSVIKLRYFLGGNPYALHFMRNNKPPIVADQTSGFSAINGHLAHYSTWNGLEEDRRFAVSGGIPAIYNQEFHQHLENSINNNKDRVTRISLEDQVPIDQFDLNGKPLKNMW